MSLGYSQQCKAVWLNQKVHYENHWLYYTSDKWDLRKLFTVYIITTLYELKITNISTFVCSYGYLKYTKISMYIITYIDIS